MENPAGGPGLLAFRTFCASWDWSLQKHWELEELPPHRRVYLVYQGPVSRFRGRVRRVDAGPFRVLHWEKNAGLLHLKLKWALGWVRLNRLKGTRWEAEWAG